MYTNNKSSFSIVDILVKVLFFIAFIVLLVLLFPTKSDISSLNNNVNRENVSYMQEAAKNYFTTDILPKEVGKSTKITLEEMIENNLILPFTDNNGNSCDYKKSYAEVVKEKTGYVLNVSLTCDGKTKTVTQKLGCYNYGCNYCNSEIIEYEFKRISTKEVTKYSCESGYTLKGSYCYKTIKGETIDATKNYKEAHYETTDALYTEGENVKVLLNTIVKKNPDVTTKEYVSAIVTEEGGGEYYTLLNTVVTVKEGATYDCSTTEKVCKDVTSSEAYKCNCTTKYKSGLPVTSCSTCYRTVTTQSCSDVKTSKTCKYADTKVYSCPSDTTTSTGSGADLKCYKKVTITPTKVYSCPKDADGSEGSGSNLKCYKLKVTPGTTTYSCPEDATSKEGSGSTLKCYKTIKTSGTYYCKDSQATLNNKTHKCTKFIERQFSHYSCPDSSYTLNGSVCVKSKTDKVEAKKTIKKEKYEEFMWSTEESIDGWERTGNTRVKE